KLASRGGRQSGAGDLAAAAGDALTANGAARWQRDGGATGMSLNVSLSGPGLPDGPVGRLLRTSATLAAEASLDDAGVLTVRQAAMRAGPAAVDSTARYDTSADKSAATAQMQAGEAGRFADLAVGVAQRGIGI